jgi:hypothetical protein
MFWPMTTLMLIYYVINGLKETRTYSIYLVTTLIIGSVFTIVVQHRSDIETPADRGGALVGVLFEGRERDLGLVVGSDPGTLFRCLFGIQANPFALVLPRGQTIGRLQVSKGQHWILALDDYDLRVPSTTLLALPGLRIVQLTRQ